MNNKHAKKGQTKDLRRPFGVAVLHISDIVQGNVIEDEDKEYFLHIQKKYKLIFFCLASVWVNSQYTSIGRFSLDILFS